MNETIFEYCIYTIVHGVTLADAVRNGGVLEETAKRRWVTGERLWKKAQTAQEKMPVVFADATDCTRLLYCGLLKDVELIDKDTRYTIEQLRKFKANEKHVPQDLVLLSTGKKIAVNFIRPYAICVTPTFVKRQLHFPAKAGAK